MPDYSSSQESLASRLVFHRSQGNIHAFGLPIELSVKLEHDPTFLCRRTVRTHKKIPNAIGGLLPVSKRRNDRAFALKLVDPVSLERTLNCKCTSSADGETFSFQFKFVKQEHLCAHLQWQQN